MKGLFTDVEMNSDNVKVACWVIFLISVLVSVCKFPDMYVCK